MTDPYKVLGISPNATDIEVKNAYRALARKYHPDNYDKDNPLADLATEKMKEINEAYDEILEMRKNGRKGNSSSGTHDHMRGEYNSIRDMINRRRMREAEAALARITPLDRTGEWHYLESLVLLHRGFVNDAMRELETACQMEPNNTEYQQAKQMFNSQARGYGRNYYGGNEPRTQSAGGCSTCDMCQGLICADCCCECMGGDLISCC